jgi:hypothetical protein
VGPEEIVDLSRVGLVIGSGGVLSHAPRRAGAFLMMLDAFQPSGVVELAVDSIFMMPHLGVLSTVDEPAATGLFEHDCLVPLGAAVAPFGKHPRRGAVLEATVELPDGKKKEVALERGAFVREELGAGEEARLSLRPARGVDVGAGPGRARAVSVRGGEAGLVFDCRGRPLLLLDDPAERRRSVASWLETMGLPSGSVEDH